MTADRGREGAAPSGFDARLVGPAAALLNLGFVAQHLAVMPRPPGPVLDHWPLAPFVALVLCQATLLALWGAFSGAPRWWRLTGLVLGATFPEAIWPMRLKIQFQGLSIFAVIVGMLCLLGCRAFGARLVRQAEPVPDEGQDLGDSIRTLLVLTAAVAALSTLPLPDLSKAALVAGLIGVFVLRAFGTRFVRRAEPASGEAGRVRISIRTVMLFMIVIAVLSALAKYMREAPSPDRLMRLWAVCIVAAGLACLWAALGRPRPVWRVIGAFLLSPLLGAFVAFSGSADRGFWIDCLSVMTLYATALLVSSWYVRSCGYRLVGREAVLTTGDGRGGEASSSLPPPDVPSLIEAPGEDGARARRI